MATIEQRFREIAYRKNKVMEMGNFSKSEDVLFLICDKLEMEDFPDPFFNKKAVISLGDGFKFLTYCGKDQRKNINKNALVIQKKLSKGDKVIYRVYLMDKDNFNIRDLFSEHGAEKSIKENNYSLNVNDYIKGIKEHYEKEELIYIINKIVEKLIIWSLEQKQ